MSTIAWDGKMIAADRSASYGGGTQTRLVTKLFKFSGGRTPATKRVQDPVVVDHRWVEQVVSSDPFYFGGVGAMSSALQIVDWIFEGCDRSKIPSFADDGGVNGMLWVPSEKLFGILSEKHLVWMPIAESFWAIGCGAEYAMGALARGASAKEAIEIASRFDRFTGSEVDTFEESERYGNLLPFARG